MENLIDAIHIAFKLLTNNFKGLTTFAQAMGAIVIITHTSSKMFKAFSSTGKVFDKDGLTPYDILLPFALIMLIAFLNPIFKGIESISELILLNSSEELKNLTEKISMLIVEDEKEAFQNLKWYNKLLEYGKNSVASFSDFLFGNVFRAILWIVDLLIIPVWYITRYFHLMVFKFFGPIIIALSVFEQTKTWAINLMKVFARAALAIIPLYFVQVISVYLQDTLPSMINTFLMEGSGGAMMLTKGGYLNVIMFFLIIVKGKLCKESFAIMDKIIP